MTILLTILFLCFCFCVYLFQWRRVEKKMRKACREVSQMTDSLYRKREKLAEQLQVEINTTPEGRDFPLFASLQRWLADIQNNKLVPDLVDLETKRADELSSLTKEDRQLPQSLERPLHEIHDVQHRLRFTLQHYLDSVETLKQHCARLGLPVDIPTPEFLQKRGS